MTCERTLLLMVAALALTGFGCAESVGCARKQPHGTERSELSSAGGHVSLSASGGEDAKGFPCPVSACSCGNAEECLMAGAEAKLTAAPGAGPRDIKGARLAFECACCMGLARGCVRLAILSEPAFGSEYSLPDEARMVAAYEAACALGDDVSCAEVAVFQLRGSGPAGVVRRDPEAAAKKLEKLCRAGGHAACWELAALLDEGKYIKQDRERAAELRELYGP